MKYIKLKDVCKINMGQSPDSSSYNESGEGIPFFQGNADFGDRYPVTRIWCSEPKKVAQENDILISVRAPIGAINYSKEKCCIGRGLAALTVDKTKISEKLLFWVLKAKKEELNRQGTGSTFKAISKKSLEELLIPQIDIKEQEKDVEILEKIYMIIQNKNKELKLLTDLISARFVELFGDAVYNDKKWETDTVKNLCKEIYGGGTPSKAHPEYYKDGDIPWVSAKDMKTDVLKDSQIKINQLGVDNSTARLVPVNSVIMVIRSGILKHTLPVAVNKVPITVNQDLKVFIPGERILTRFLAVQFKMQEKDILSGVRAVTADNIEFNSLKQRRMIVPPIDLQQKYLMFLERIDKSKFVIHKFLYCTTHNTKSIIKPRPNTKESGKIRGGKPHADEF